MTEYTVVISPCPEEDGGGYVAYYPDLPGCLSDGETAEEALANANDALNAWMSAQKERNSQIPKPGDAIEVQRQREKDLLEAMRTFVDFSDHAEGRIAELEYALAEILERIDRHWDKASPLVAHAAARGRHLIAKH